MSEANMKTSKFPTWCPGCGDFGIWGAIQAAVTQSGWPLERLVVVYGIGCSGNMASHLKVYGLHGLHGRALPAAAGVKLANHKLKVIVVAGDGDLLGEGMGHFIAACRANHDLTVILHDNQVYGLTTGQSSPTSLKESKGKSTPGGVIDEPINVVQLALTAGATHVMRGFSGDIPQLTELIKKGMDHEGISILEVLQPCVTFNKINTYDWFRQRIETLKEPFASAYEALGAGVWRENKIWLGEFYKDKAKKSFDRQWPVIAEKTLIQLGGEKRDLSLIQKELG